MIGVPIAQTNALAGPGNDSSASAAASFSRAVPRSDSAVVNVNTVYFGASADTVGDALASYQRTLVAGDSPFDRYRYGGASDALNAEEKAGHSIFTGKGRCAACHLIGEHDFSSFRSSMCQSPTPVKHLRDISIARVIRADRGTAYWRFDFEGQAFLHHMIRNIMGCLVAVGTGTQSPVWVQQVLEARDRRVAAPTFAPDGLYFLGPTYAEHWNLPQHVSAMDWLPS